MNGEIGELGRLSAAVAGFCRQQPAGEGVELHLNVVLEELFVNAVEHGGCKGLRDAVEVRLIPAGGAVLVEFADRGLPFDPSSAAEPDLDAPLSRRMEGGLGLHFVRQLARDLAYRRDGAWNRLALRLPPVEPESS